MGGVGAICREREGGGEVESGEGEIERRKELRRQEKLWMIPKPKVEVTSIKQGIESLPQTQIFKLLYLCHLMS